MQNGARGVYPRLSKSLHDQMIKLQAGINRDFQMHTETILMAREILSKCGVFWYQISTVEEAFHINLVTTAYGEAVSLSGRA